MHPYNNKDIRQRSKVLSMERPRKLIAPNHYGLFYQVIGSLRLSNPAGFDSGESARYQLLPLWVTSSPV
jgi:hypothetical protein